MSADTPFDRHLRRLRRDRAAPLFAGADYLHRLAGEEMLGRLEDVKRDFTDALVLGADPQLVAALRAQGLAVTAADPGFRFANTAGGVQCDEDRLAVADASFDLVISTGLLDTVNDLPGALVLIRRALRPGGLFLGAFAGAGSLPRLKAAMLAGDAVMGGAVPRIHPQIDVRAAGDLLARAGFVLPVADVGGVDVRYPGLAALVADLRAMGGTNLLPAGAQRPVTRADYAAANAAFAAHADADGKTAERFEIVYLSAWSRDA
ncbi:Methyltransferase domain-containing protein [Allosphingosinicella indica]|uniref:Methyltransferase domain-containing protein n=2 Tax=Allosphingosinicella indica TaxID=941907 RepID=A0A1X7GRE9_9SPHN|nr:Methyltransferase domain-containing protein [Allosphingosinicella indica]